MPNFIRSNIYSPLLDPALNNFKSVLVSLEDIEKEIDLCKDCFNNKIVYLNFEDATYSNFWRFFYMHYNSLKIRKLISTSYHHNIMAYKYEYNETCKDMFLKTSLLGDGDFRSEESINILKDSDIIVSAAPIRLIKEYITQLIQYNKKFLIAAPIDTVTHREIFPLIKNNKIYISNPIKIALNDNGEKCAGICWITNLECLQHNNIEEYYSLYSEELYPKYDNYDAINVDKVIDIPCNYKGVIGVPITFLYKYSPKQFDIIGIADGKNVKINNKRKYFRILIRWKLEAMPEINNLGIIIYKNNKQSEHKINDDKSDIVKVIIGNTEYIFKQDMGYPIEIIERNTL